jgi:P-type Ca2+ transporter type 2B
LNLTLKCVVMRNGIHEEIHQDLLHVGDVVFMKYGMKIPVDGVCLHANSLKMDESAMTGESDELIKDSYANCVKRMEELDMEKRAAKSHEKHAHDLPSPIILSGSSVSEGDGMMLSIAVGDNSAIGIIRKTLEAETEETPLEAKLDKIAGDIGKLGTIAAVFVIHILLARYLCEGLVKRKLDLFGGEVMAGNVLLENIKLWVQIFIIGVAIIVVAVPEGLPLAVMISLAYSIGKMAKDNNDVKRLAACEIMGGCDNVCSDKTGTLTENIMKVTRVWCGKEQPEISQERKVGGKQGELCDLKWQNLGMHPNFFPAIEAAIALNTPDQLGATDKAMDEFISRCGCDKVALKKKHLPELKNLIRFPFNSTRKRMSTIIENATGKGGYDKRIFIKGGSDVILDVCNKYMDENG